MDIYAQMDFYILLSSHALPYKIKNVRGKLWEITPILALGPFLGCMKSPGTKDMDK